MIGDHLVVLPMLVPLVAAVATLVVRQWRPVQRAVSVVGVLAYAGAVAALAWSVETGEAHGLATQLGGWPAPFGITLVADGLATFMLAMTATMAVPALVISLRSIDPDEKAKFYHSLFHFLLLGITGATLTGDLFSLFVWFEVMLIASYAFIAFRGGPGATRASFIYVTLNLVASAVLLLAIGGIYASVGTLNMADVARLLADPTAEGVDQLAVLGCTGLLLAVFALKAGLVPFQFWVPSAYGAAPLPIVALFAAATKKVGVYAIVRLYFTVFAAQSTAISMPLVGDSPMAFYGVLLLAMAIASILVGGIGALSADSLDRLLAYSSIGQVGFIVLPLGLAGLFAHRELTVGGEPFVTLAVLATLVYALNHTLAKGLLFLSTAAVEQYTGSRSLAAVSGLAARSPVLGAVFLVGLLALVGIPPLSGFFGKLLVFEAAAIPLLEVGASADESVAGGSVAGGSVAGASTLLVAILLVLVVGSLLTIAYTSRAWNRCFWGAQSDVVRGGRADPVLLATLVGLASAIVLVGVGFEPVYRFAESAAHAATDTEAYVDVVFEESAGGEAS